MHSYINIHSHNFKKSEGIQIVSHSINDPIQYTPYISIGLHPWHIDTITSDQQLDLVENQIKKHPVIAIGECGIDRSISLEIQLQKHIFEKQVLLSEKLKLPLIIHCVRAWFDCLEIRKKTKAQQAWIFHGYTGNLDTAKKIIAQNCYVSFGEKIVRNEKNQKVLSSLDVKHIFLETDDAAISIAKIYSFAAQIKHMDTFELLKSMQNNFTSIFKK